MFRRGFSTYSHAFSLTLRNPVAKANNYLKTIRWSDYGYIKKWFPEYQKMVSGNYDTDPRFQYNYEEFKTILTSYFVNPKSFQMHPIYLKDWYDDQTLKDVIKNKMTLRAFEDSDDMLPHFYRGQQPFFEWIRQQKNFPITEESWEQYRKFLFLVKKHGMDKCQFVPTREIDICWHAHMMDHEAYCRDTKNYFGKVLGHNDKMGRHWIVSLMDSMNKMWIDEFGQSLFVGDIQKIDQIEEKSNKDRKTKHTDNNQFNNSYHPYIDEKNFIWHSAACATLSGYPLDFQHPGEGYRFINRAEIDIFNDNNIEDRENEEEKK